MKINFWKGKRVFVTGHTGFKGGWLSLWLSELGADVYGYALEPPTEPSFFSEVSLKSRMHTNILADIRKTSALEQAMNQAQPEVVFHLAAQSLLPYSYGEPQETYETNVMGTIAVLEAVRKTPTVRAVVNVTSDKCYQNREWEWPYRENDSLGGFDPYSSSKACAELVTSAWRDSFFAETQVQLASVRSGNVIGGGDWACDRLIPDLLRAVDRDEPLIVRYPKAIRPWQHVLEPLAGYLRLAVKLYEEGSSYAEAWNFGPDENDMKPVEWIVEHLCQRLPGARWCEDPSANKHETTLLRLDSSKSRSRLSWKGRWNLIRALDETVDWHRAWKEGESMMNYSLSQIHSYMGEGECP